MCTFGPEEEKARRPDPGVARSSALWSPLLRYTVLPIQQVLPLALPIPLVLTWICRLRLFHRHHLMSNMLTILFQLLVLILTPVGTEVKRPLSSTGTATIWSTIVQALG